MPLEGFELFKKPKRSRATAPEPVVTVYRNGLIGFNKAALTKWNLGDNETVALLWDAKGRRIAVQPSSDPQSSYRLRYQENGTVQISAKSFFEHYGISLDSPLAQTPDLIGNAMVIELPKA